MPKKKLAEFLKPRPGVSAAGDLLWLSSLGINLILSTALGLGGGWYLDKWFHSRPWLTIIGFLLGTFAGFWQIVRAIKAIDSSFKPDGPRKSP
jgi:ATP synthase protein I